MKTATLGEISTLHYGKALQGYKDLTKQDAPYQVFGTNGAIGWSKSPLFEGPAIIIGRKGAYRETHWSDSDGWVIDTAYYLALTSKDIDLRWLYYKLKTIDLNRLDSGSAIPSTKREDFYSVRIQYPQKELQVEYVQVLDQYTNLIENNRRRIQLLEESARLLYQEWFVHLRFPGHEHVKVVDGVPEGWERSTVKSLGEVVTGKTPSTKDSGNYGDYMPFIKTPDMHSSSIVLYTDEYLSEKGTVLQKNKTLPPDSVLIACIGAKLGVVSLNAFPSQTNQQINAVIPSQISLRYYTYLMLKGFRESLLAIGGGATMPNVNKGKFEAMTVILPEQSLLESFHEVVEPTFHQIKNLLLMTSKLEKARDLLLPRLMNGELII